MKLRILGCSGGVAQGLKTTSMLINDSILIDAGSGVGDLRLEEMANIRHLFITHSHLDHISFLPLLLDSVFDSIFEPITVHAQPATIAAIQEHVFNWTIWPDFTILPSTDNAVIKFSPMHPGEQLTVKDYQFDMIEVNHIVPAVGYRVCTNEKSFAFSGDTTTNDNFWDELNKFDDLDVLIVETAFPERHKDLAIKAKHYTPSLLAEDLKKLKHQPEVYLTHLKPGDEQQIIQEARSLITSHSIKILENDSIFKL